MKALIAEDARVDRRLLVGILRHHLDFEEIIEAKDGAEALEWVRNEQFQLILLDWNMPKMQGIDVLRKIRDENVNTPVIMVTGEKDRASVVEAFDAGANNYIVKPFGASTVAAKIKNTLRGVSRNSQRPTAKRALVVDASAVMRKVLAGMLDRACHFREIVQAEDGLEALRVAKSGDFDLILLDWNMPKMLGIDTLKAIRKYDAETPVIMVTNEKEEARVVEALEAGANNYVVKPFEPSTIAKVVKQTLHLEF